MCEGRQKEGIEFIRQAQEHYGENKSRNENIWREKQWLTYGPNCSGFVETYEEITWNMEPRGKYIGNKMEKWRNTEVEILNVV